jgi:hypothetical protein
MDQFNEYCDDDGDDDDEASVTSQNTISCRGKCHLVTIVFPIKLVSYLYMMRSNRYPVTWLK